MNRNSPPQQQDSPHKLDLRNYGGFRGLKSADTEPLTARDRRKKVEEHMPEAKITHIDPLAVRCAEAPFTAWAAEKERRVATAFCRIVERDWYDKYELTLRPVERAHMNAVREHYAMRRDKLLTPDIQARPKSNTLTKQAWCESMEAIEILHKDTHVGSFFQGLVGRHIQKRLHQEEAARKKEEERKNNKQNNNNNAAARMMMLSKPDMTF